MKFIPLTQGKFAIVDDEDFERINQYKWQAVRHKDTFYAARNKWNSTTKRMKLIYMHRQILHLLIGTECDHKNHNGLNNRKQNLRAATTAQNRYNQLPRKNGTSKLKGVYWDKNGHKWHAKITKDSKSLYLGLFVNESDVADAYDKMAKRLFGEFAYLNFPEKTNYCISDKLSV